MQRSRKRKQQHRSPKPVDKTITEAYPLHPRPTPEECVAIRDSLLSLHGFPPEFSKYRLLRISKSHPINAADDIHAKCEPSDQESVLDGLVKTVLSQNTTELNSLRAFGNLNSAFPSWDDVLGADTKCVENAIRCGGLAPTKAKCIKNILSCLLERKGKLCLEYLRELSVNEIKAELSHFKGIGPKTIACVLMFNLQEDDFPVDTHVFEIAKTIGWVPEAADRNKTYLHLNHRIPNELKFDLNCLLYTHGKLCRKCCKKASNQQRKESSDESCPLINYQTHEVFRKNVLVDSYAAGALRIFMEVKRLRLFGIDVNPLEGSQEGSKNGNPPVEVPRQTKKNAGTKSSESHALHKMYECEFCFKKFKNSQALGGHQNAHKKERQKKRRLQLQEKIQNYSIHHNSLPYFGYFSPFVSHFQFCQDSVISFNTLHNHNQNVNSDTCFAIAGNQCTAEGE